MRLNNAMPLKYIFILLFAFFMSSFKVSYAAVTARSHLSVSLQLPATFAKHNVFNVKLLGAATKKLKYNLKKQRFDDQVVHVRVYSDKKNKFSIDNISGSVKYRENKPVLTCVSSDHVNFNKWVPAKNDFINVYYDMTLPAGNVNTYKPVINSSILFTSETSQYILPSNWSWANSPATEASLGKYVSDVNLTFSFKTKIPVADSPKQCFGVANLIFQEII